MKLLSCTACGADLVRVQMVVIYETMGVADLYLGEGPSRRPIAYYQTQPATAATAPRQTGFELVCPHCESVLDLESAGWRLDEGGAMAVINYVPALVKNCL